MYYSLPCQDISHCNTHCNTLQHTNCNTMQDTATYYKYICCTQYLVVIVTLQSHITQQHTLQHAAARILTLHCNTLQRSVYIYTVPNALQYSSSYQYTSYCNTHCNILRHTATHCNTQTATHYNTLCVCVLYPTPGCKRYIINTHSTATATHCNTQTATNRNTPHHNIYAVPIAF